MDTLTTALTWRSLGISCIPILARSKSPALAKWKPFQSRLPTEFELRAWFTRPGYNIAVITGWQGLVIVDFDDIATLKAMTHLPSTYQVITARGYHFYYYVTEPTRCVKMDGVDIKAAGGYCLTPPSVHPSGAQYRRCFFDIKHINRINSVADFIPEYQQAISKPPPRPQVSKLDPLDAAMLPHTSTTIEEANAKLSYEQMLSPVYSRTVLRVCPFHEDTHPSLKVYGKDRGWHCFGCGASGRDKLDMYAQLHNMTIREALCTL